jgi:DNA-binding NarL/FixJ family response regulator
MAEKEIRALLIEDNPGDVILLQETFGGTETVSVRIQVATRLSEGLARLRLGGIEVVLLDLDLPDSHGLATLTTLKQQAPHMPVLVMTGRDDPVLAERLVKEGANECFVKGRYDSSDLIHAIRFAILRQGVHEVQDEVDTRDLPAAADSALSNDSSSSGSAGAEAQALPSWQKRILVQRVGYVMDSIVGAGPHGNPSSIPVRLESIASELRKNKVGERDIIAIVAACVEEKTSGTEVALKLDYQQEGRRMLETLVQMVRV